MGVPINDNQINAKEQTLIEIFPIIIAETDGIYFMRI